MFKSGLIHLLNREIIIGKELISYKVLAFHENPDRIYTEPSKRDKQCKSRSDCSCRSSLILVHIVCLFTYINQ